MTQRGGAREYYKILSKTCAMRAFVYMRACAMSCRFVNKWGKMVGRRHTARKKPRVPMGIQIHLLRYEALGGLSASAESDALPWSRPPTSTVPSAVCV